jgi:hypothetical protein
MINHGSRSRAWRGFIHARIAIAREVLRARSEVAPVLFNLEEPRHPKGSNCVDSSLDAEVAPVVRQRDDVKQKAKGDKG